MEKYRLIQEHKADESQQHELLAGSETLALMTTSHFPEIRITQQGKPRSYISYALQLFNEGSTHTIVLKAMGRAINKAVTIAEIIKRKLPVHQLNQLTSVEMMDVYMPLEEGLDAVTNHRHVSCMRITLSLTATALDTSHYGYQPPLPKDEMSPAVPANREQYPYQRTHSQQQPYHHGAAGAATTQHYLMSPNA